MYKAVMTESFSKKALEYGTQFFDINILESVDTQEIIKACMDAEVVFVRRAKLSAEVFDACPHLKAACKPAAGVDAVDIPTATKHGIPVLNAPGGNSQAVAEFTAATILSSIKTIFDAHAVLYAGDYPRARKEWAGVDVYGRTLLVAGFGNIGRRVAKIMHAMDMKIMIYDPYVSKADVEACGYIYCDSLHDALPLADVISLHMPLTDASKHMIAAKEFDLMKPTAVLINNARGACVDEAEFAKRLNEGKIARGAVDAYVTEPPAPDHPYLTAKNLILTPHVAGISPASVDSMGFIGFDRTLRCLQGEHELAVNPDCFNHPRYK